MQPDFFGPQGENGVGSGTKAHNSYGSRPPAYQGGGSNVEGVPDYYFVERDRR